MSFKYETLIVEVEPHYAVVTINREKQLNAINRQVYAELLDAFLGLAAVRPPRAVVVTGSGKKAFAAGADIAAMKEMTVEEARQFALLGKKVSQAVAEYAMPVIAAVNGFALGGGCELAMSCDLILAGEGAVFGQPEVNLGLIPGNGGTQRLSRMVGMNKAKELIFFGRQVNAARAYELGVVNKVLPAGEDVLGEAKKWAEELAGKAGLALALAKRSITLGADADLNTALEYEVACFAQCFATEDKDEGIEAFMERRRPEFKGK